MNNLINCSDDLILPPNSTETFIGFDNLTPTLNLVGYVCL